MVMIRKQTRIQISKEGIDKIDVITYLEVEVPHEKPGPVEAVLGFLYRWIKGLLRG